MKKILRLSAIALIALAGLTFVGCDFLGAMLAVEGNVVNARAEKTATEWYKDKSSGTTLVGATVTFTNLSDSSKTTATVDSLGKYYVSLSAGRYSMSGTQSGWTFVPRTVDVSGFAAKLPDLLAYVTPGANAILLIMEWEDRTIDVDMHTVIDDQNLDTTDPTVTASPALLGTVNYSTGNTDLFNVKLERDITKTELDASLPAVETVLIDANPFTVDSTGWLRLYLKAWTDPSGNLTGNSTAATPIKEARALVHAMQGTTHLGTFKIATETQEEMIGVLKIKVYPITGGTGYDIMSIGNFDNTAKNIQ